MVYARKTTLNLSVDSIHIVNEKALVQFKKEKKKVGKHIVTVKCIKITFMIPFIRLGLS